MDNELPTYAWKAGQNCRDKLMKVLEDYQHEFSFSTAELEKITGNKRTTVTKKLHKLKREGYIELIHDKDEMWARWKVENDE